MAILRPPQQHVSFLRASGAHVELPRSVKVPSPPSPPPPPPSHAIPHEEMQGPSGARMTTMLHRWRPLSPRPDILVSVLSDRMFGYIMTSEPYIRIRYPMSRCPHIAVQSLSIAGQSRLSQRSSPDLAQYSKILSCHCHCDCDYSSTGQISL